MRRLKKEMVEVAVFPCYKKLVSCQILIRTFVLMPGLFTHSFKSRQSLNVLRLYIRVFGMHKILRVVYHMVRVSMFFQCVVRLPGVTYDHLPNLDVMFYYSNYL